MLTKQDTLTVDKILADTESGDRTMDDIRRRVREALPHITDDDLNHAINEMVGAPGSESGKARLAAGMSEMRRRLRL
jgi:hypothetical protein